MPHLDDFNGVMHVVDQVEDAIRALTNPEESGCPGELFTTRWARLRGE